MWICHVIAVCSIKLSYKYMEKKSHTTLVFVLLLLIITYYIHRHNLRKSEHWNHSTAILSRTHARTHTHTHPFNGAFIIIIIINGIYIAQVRKVHKCAKCFYYIHVCIFWTLNQTTYPSLIRRLISYRHQEIAIQWAFDGQQWTANDSSLCNESKFDV